MFQVILEDVRIPDEVEAAITVLRGYGYKIDPVPTGKVVIELHDTDSQLANFFRVWSKNKGTNFGYNSSYGVDFIDLEMLAFVAHQLHNYRGDENRSRRHDIVAKYFSYPTSTELYRNLAGFSKALSTLDPDGKYSIRFIE